MAVVPYDLWDEWVPMKFVLKFCDPAGIADVGIWFCEMLQKYGNRFVDLSIDNVELCSAKKKCRLVDDTPLQNSRKPEAFRWYKRKKSCKGTEYFIDLEAAAARAMLEYILGREPFYSKSNWRYRKNLLEQNFTFTEPSAKFPELTKRLVESMNFNGITEFAIRRSAADYRRHRLASKALSTWQADMEKYLNEYTEYKDAKKSLTPPGLRNSCSKAAGSDGSDELIEVRANEPQLAQQ